MDPAEPGRLVFISTKDGEQRPAAAQPQHINLFFFFLVPSHFTQSNRRGSCSPTLKVRPQNFLLLRYGLLVCPHTLSKQ